MRITRDSLFFSVCVLLLPAPSGAQNSAAAVTPLDTQVQAVALDRASAIDPRSSWEPRLMAHALRRLASDDSDDARRDIAIDVRRQRANIERLCSTLPAVVGAAGTLACLPANATWPGVSILCGATMAVGVITACSELERLYSIEVPPTREMLGTFRTTDRGIVLWDAAFATANGGLRLDDSAAAVLARDVELARVVEDRYGELLEEVDGGGFNQSADDSSEILQLQDRSLELLADIRAEIEIRNDVVDTFVKEAWAREIEARDNRRNAIDVANAKAAFGVATALLGRADEPAGRKLEAVGHAAFGLYDAVEAFNLANGLGANPLLSQVALAGSLVRVGLGFVNGLSDAGPTTEEVILNEVRALDQKIEDFRAEVEAQFGLVHEHLDDVIKELDAGFRAVEDHIDAGIGELKTALDGIRSDLRGLDAGIEGVAHAVHFTYREELRLHDAVMQAILGPATLDCTDSRISSPTEEFLVSCGNHFRTLANLVKSDQIGALPDEMFSVRNVHEDRTTNISFLEFKRRLAAVGATPWRSDDVVGPEAWFDVMKAKEEFLKLHRDAEGRPEVLVHLDFRRTMAGHRDDLASYREAIVEELRAFADSESPRETVFSTVIGEAEDRLVDLDDLIRSTVDSWFATEEYDGRTIPSGDGGVRPETGYRHPYDWEAMSTFYGVTGNERPEWLNILAPNQCGGQESRGGAGRVEWQPDARFLDAWFAGSGVADFVREEDLMPARLGMGTIEVCVTAGGEPRTPDYVKAQIWFDRTGEEMGESSSGCPQRVRLLDGLGIGNGSLTGEAGLMAMMATVARDVRGRNAVLVGGDGRCRELYLARFDDERQALADHVRTELQGHEQFGQIDRTLDSLELHVQSWLKLALDGVRGRSETVDALVSARIRLPDVSALVKGDGEWYAWELADVAVAALGEFEETLRSGRFGDALSYGTFHRLLDRQYESLGGTEVEVIER